MQDYGRAVILGENSFGKGTVQQHRSLNHIYDLFDNELGYVQYTIQKFYRIDGGSTQNKGVIPDIHYPTPIDPAETGESVEDNALPWDSIEPAKYTKLSDESALIKKLTDQHVKRIQNDMEFGFIEDDIVRYKEEKDSNELSLNLKTREQESEKREVLRLERINERQKANGEEAFKSLDDVPSDYKAPDAYLDESISIMVDMLSDSSNS